MSIVDLRSDTVTKPTPGMRQAMANAEVGDDVYGEDPTVKHLEHRVAELLGKEAALFCATGSMANLLGIWSLTRDGGEVLCDSQAHIARAEMGAHAALHGVTMRTWTNSTGMPKPEELASLVAPDLGPFLVKTAVVEFENTHNFAGGVVLDHSQLTQLCESAHRLGVQTHLDGARLWHANIASGIDMANLSAGFDTVSVCFSKGLGAPIGSVLAGPKTLIDQAWIQRKRLGGGWRQAGLLAAAAEYALDEQWQRLAEDHHNARVMAELVASYQPNAIDPNKVETNILVIDVGALSAADLVKYAANAGIRISQLGPNTVRAVTHLGISEADVKRAGQVIGQFLAQLPGQ